LFVYGLLRILYMWSGAGASSARARPSAEGHRDGRRDPSLLVLLLHALEQVVALAGVQRVHRLQEAREAGPAVRGHERADPAAPRADRQRELPPPDVRHARVPQVAVQAG